MSLRAILEEIRARGEAEILDIEEDSEKRVNEILEQARVEAEKIRREACEEVAAPADEERSRVINHANLRALRILDEARQASIDETLKRVRQRLAEIRGDEVYADVLCGLVREAIKDMGKIIEKDGKVLLQADERDRELVEEVLRGFDREIAVSYDLDTWGGLIARSEDGRVAVYNTLESRLEQARPYLSRYLAARFSR